MRNKKRILAQILIRISHFMFFDTKNMEHLLLNRHK